tara:strand:- start:6944 stop:7420 length:477 start_codon:yes stop_codon:yes gene_type:complete
MNIFVVNSDPQIAARQLCDKHVVKMILESAQMLCSAFENGEAPYRRAYYNHPCTKWARESQANYEWLLTHAYELCEEYFSRYGKTHKSLNAIDWCDNNSHKLGLDQEIGLTPFAQAMPDEYKNHNAVKAYRAYYNAEKAYFATWKSKTVPRWFKAKKS